MEPEHRPEAPLDGEGHARPSKDQAEVREAQQATQAAYGQLREARKVTRQAEEDFASKVEELLQANQQLAQLDRMKDNFLSLLSHELRTPISAILGYVSILDDELAGPVPEDQHGYSRKVMREAEKLLSLVNNILDMNRLLSGQMTFERRPLSLQEVVENVLARFVDAAEKKPGVRVETDIPWDLPAFLADEQRLGQVLSNLIDNGIRFTRHGTVTLRARRDDDTLRIDVEDSGPGIPADDLPHLFRVLGQLDDSATRQKGGLGLGLALAKGLTEAMGGAIGIASEIGKGTTVTVTLPFQAVDE